MQVWHLQPDTPRSPERVSAGEWVNMDIGTWPMEPGQEVWVEFAFAPDEPSSANVARAAWRHNAGPNSYWRAELGPFPDGARVRYQVFGRSPADEVRGPVAEFCVGPKLHLALCWHQHQPLYKDLAAPEPRGSYTQPWVRLHATRDYYSMAALVAEHPRLHLTINITPVLLWQIEDYVERGATDRAMELTRTPAESLSDADRDELLQTFFDADWHNQIFPHPRYKELFTKRQEGQSLSPQDLRDLQMWFNLAWFGKEFRDGAVRLVTGETASVQRFIAQQRGFTPADIEAMLHEQVKIMRAIVPSHRALQEAGQIEVSTTPFYHPILPLLIQTEHATIDRPGATRPSPPLSRPEDARAHIQRAIDHYVHCFGTRPRGIWPAEGAVSEAIVPLLANAALKWMATDEGVLARSGRWGYRVDDANVLCQTYRAEQEGASVAVFFRSAWLANHIGFHYHGYPDHDVAAREFLSQIKERFARQVSGTDNRILTVVLDGENAWSAYRDDARPFLHALYGLLERDDEVRTVTFSEFLEGAPARGVESHDLAALPQVHALATGSWIDEMGSAPGVDLGTWIGEVEENRGWALLRETRDDLEASGATPDTNPAAYESMYAAEGSDWFWWFGEDQDSGMDATFDDLFRLHLANTYRLRAARVPSELGAHIIPRAVVWTMSAPVATIQPGDRLLIQTNCAGTLTWWISDRATKAIEHARDSATAAEIPLQPVGGVMGGVGRYQALLGPFEPHEAALHFRFRCTSPGCDQQSSCCRGIPQTVTIAPALRPRRRSGKAARR